MLGTCIVILKINRNKRVLQFFVLFILHTHTEFGFKVVLSGGTKPDFYIVLNSCLVKTNFVGDERATECKSFHVI